MTPLKLRSLLTTVILLWFFLLQASEEAATRRKCRCLRTITCVPASVVQEIHIIPRSAMCRRTEILMTGKHNNTVCLDPESQCIKNVVERFLKEKEANKPDK